MKFKEWFEWNILGKIQNLFIPIVSIDYITKKKASYSGSDDKYNYYWIGNFKNGKSVKVKKEVID